MTSNAAIAAVIGVAILVALGGCTKYRNVSYDRSSAEFSVAPDGFSSSARRLYPLEAGIESACWRIDLEPLVQSGKTSIKRAVLRLISDNEKIPLNDEGSPKEIEPPIISMLNINSSYLPSEISTIGKKNDFDGSWTQLGAEFVSAESTNSDVSLWQQQLQFGSEQTGLGSFIAAAMHGDKAGHYGTIFNVYPIEFCAGFHHYANGYYNGEVIADYARNSNPVMEFSWPIMSGYVDVDITKWVNKELAGDQSLTVVIQRVMFNRTLRLVSDFHERKLKVSTDSCVLYVE